MVINCFMWILRFINVVMNMYKVNIIGYMVIKVSECYEHVHGVVWVWIWVWVWVSSTQ